MSLTKLVQEIESKLQRIHSGSYGGTMYIDCTDCDGDVIRIRVSDHCCNDRNNDDKRCLSFISNYSQRTTGQWQNNLEWVINSDLQTSGYETIEEILSDYCLVSYKFLGKTIILN